MDIGCNIDKTIKNLPVLVAKKKGLQVFILTALCSDFFQPAFICRSCFYISTPYAAERW